MIDFNHEFAPLALATLLVGSFSLIAYIQTLREQVAQLREREARNDLWVPIGLDNPEYDFLLDDFAPPTYQPIPSDPEVIRRRLGL